MKFVMIALKPYALPKLSALAAALLLTGCTLAPHYERPDAPVAQVWPEMGIGVAAQQTDGIVASELRWQDFYGDPRLQVLIELALENNRDLRIAALNVEKSRATHQIQRSELLPSVNASGDMTRTTTGTGGLSPAQYSETAQNMGSNRVYTASIGVVSYELDFFGRVRSLNQAALANYFATVEAQKTAQISLVSAVAASYYALLADAELLRLTEETLQTRLESLKLTELKFKHGVTSELDVRQAETLVESARFSLAQLKRQYAQDQNAFEVLIGGRMPEDLPEGAQLSAQNALMPELSSGVPSDVLMRRPDITASEQQLIAANANIGAARAAFFPKISLTGAYGKASDDLGDLFSSGHFWRFVPSISLPIFTGGRNAANLDIAKASQQIAVAQYEKTIQTAFKEVA
ncbi:MAG: efflux transporter outer membrane subunit, partial [Saezia sp.]